MELELLFRTSFLPLEVDDGTNAFFRLAALLALAVGAVHSIIFGCFCAAYGNSRVSADDGGRALGGWRGFGRVLFLHLWPAAETVSAGGVSSAHIPIAMR